MKRDLAGMLHKVDTTYITNCLSLMLNPLLMYLGVQVGLLQRDSMAQVHDAYTFYMANSSNEDELQEFRTTFCHNVPINFIGVWWVTVLV
jgi:uncharacterized protein YacL